MRDGVGVGGATPLWPSGLPWRGRGVRRSPLLVVSCPWSVVPGFLQAVSPATRRHGERGTGGWSSRQPWRVQSERLRLGGDGDQERTADGIGGYEI